MWSFTSVKSTRNTPFGPRGFTCSGWWGRGGPGPRRVPALRDVHSGAQVGEGHDARRSVGPHGAPGRRIPKCGLGLDYRNERTRFLFNLAAGAGAAILRRGLSRNEVLESHIITDGSFSEDVVIGGGAGGTKKPLTPEGSPGGSPAGCPDPRGMRRRLEERSIRASSRRSGKPWPRAVIRSGTSIISAFFT